MPIDKKDMPNCFYRVSVKALILDDQKRFLLMKEHDGVWDLPGGGLDFGEDPRECLTREIKEEAGLEVISISEQPKYFLTALHRDRQWWLANAIYETKIKDFNFQPSPECTELKFFTKDEAAKENLLLNVVEFIKIYNPERHYN